MKLSESIGIYVDRKRANGVDFSKGQQTLLSFRKSVGDLTLDGITCQHLLGFLDGLGTSTTTWRSKHSLLCHFFEYWISREQMRYLILPPSRPLQPTKFVPFIYTKAEIHSLLQTVRSAQRHEFCSLDAATTRIVLLTLYATGALVSEILDAEYKDLDLKIGFLTIRTRQFSRSRRIPLNCDLLEQLRRYVALRNKKVEAGGYLFLNRSGSIFHRPI